MKLFGFDLFSLGICLLTIGIFIGFIIIFTQMVGLTTNKMVVYRILDKYKKDLKLFSCNNTSKLINLLSKVKKENFKQINKNNIKEKFTNNVIEELKEKNEIKNEIKNKIKNKIEELKEKSNAIDKKEIENNKKNWNVTKKLLKSIVLPLIIVSFLVIGIDFFVSKEGWSYIDANKLSQIFFLLLSFISELIIYYNVFQKYKYINIYSILNTSYKSFEIYHNIKNDNINLEEVVKNGQNVGKSDGEIQKEIRRFLWADISPIIKEKANELYNKSTEKNINERKQENILIISSIILILLIIYTCYGYISFGYKQNTILSIIILICLLLFQLYFIKYIMFGSKYSLIGVSDMIYTYLYKNVIKDISQSDIDSLNDFVSLDNLNSLVDIDSLDDLNSLKIKK